MRKHIPFISVAALLACSTGTGGVDGGGDAASETGATDPFVGTFACTSQYAITFTSPSGAAPINTSYPDTATDVDNGDGTFSATQTGVGLTCVLKWTYSGATATLASGQSCTFTGTQTNIPYAYSGGMISIAGGVITGQINATFANAMMQVSVDGGAPMTVTGAAGSLAATTSCTKQ